MRRATSGQPTSMMAMQMVIRLGPRMSVMTMASSMTGKARNMSVTRMMIASTQPP